MPAAYAVVRCLSVCLPVCLSVTFVYCVKMSKHIYNFFHLRVATILLLRCTKHYGNILKRTPLTQHRMQLGGV